MRHGPHALRDTGLTSDETRGLMCGETRGLMCGETRGLMSGETRGLMSGETRGLMSGETRGLIWGEMQGRSATSGGAEVSGRQCRRKSLAHSHFDYTRRITRVLCLSYRNPFTIEFSSIVASYSESFLHGHLDDLHLRSRIGHSRIHCLNCFHSFFLFKLLII